MSINPIRLVGNWDEGWALDSHSISSVYKGENAYGHPEFDTVRSELGQQIFRLKNRNRIEAIDNIIEIIKPFLENWDKLKNVDVVMPVPPTKKDRIIQPAFEIANAIAEYADKCYIDDVLVKTTDEQSKDLDISVKGNLVGSILATKKAKHRHNILLVDDLTSSGMTLNLCAEVLKKDENVDKIYVLAMTKTRK